MFYNFEAMNDNRNHHAKTANHPWFEDVVKEALLAIATSDNIEKVIMELEQLLGSRLEAEGASLEMNLVLKYPNVGPHRPFGVTIMKAAKGLRIKPSYYRDPVAARDEEQLKRESA